jgi:hypothetical protein
VYRLVPHTYLNSNSDKIPLIAMWCRFKMAFPNSVIYNYTPHSLHTKGRLPISRNTITKYVNLFIENGLAQMKGKHLILTPKRTVLTTSGGKGFGRWVQIEPSQDIQNTLRRALLVTKRNQQGYSSVCRHFRGTPHKKLKGLMPKDYMENLPLKMGKVQMAKYLGCSRWKLNKTISQLSAQGQLIVRPKEMRLIAKAPSPRAGEAIITALRSERFKKREISGFLFFHRGLVLEIPPTEIWFPEQKVEPFIQP